MIPQHTPLYATAGGQEFIVIGWVPVLSITGRSLGDMTPVLAPLDMTGPVRPLEAESRASYSPTPSGLPAPTDPRAEDTAVLHIGDRW
jgi:hypothetical protein